MIRKILKCYERLGRCSALQKDWSATEGDICPRARADVHEMAFQASWNTCTPGIIYGNFNRRMPIKQHGDTFSINAVFLFSLWKPSRRTVKPSCNLVLPKKCDKSIQSLKMTICQQYYASPITYIPQPWAEAQRGQLCLTSQSFNIRLNTALRGNLPKNTMQDGFYMQDTVHHSTIPGPKRNLIFIMAYEKAQAPMSARLYGIDVRGTTSPTLRQCSLRPGLENKGNECSRISADCCWCSDPRCLSCRVRPALCLQMWSGDSVRWSEGYPEKIYPSKPIRMTCCDNPISPNTRESAIHSTI